MKKNAQILIDLVNECIFNKPCDIEKIRSLTDDDLVELFNISKEQDLIHIVGYTLKKYKIIPEDSVFFKPYQKETFKAIYRYEKFKYDLDEISDVFEKNKIPFILLKGSYLRKFYPEEWLRTSCDMDILVHESDLDRAVKVLVEELSYEAGAKSNHDISITTTNEMNLELHYNLIEDIYFPESAAVLADIWDNVENMEGYEYNKVMSNEMFYFYHLAHIAKHFSISGCGIRPFLDIIVILNNMPLNMDKLNKLLETAKLSAFAKGAENLAKYWFADGEKDETVELMEDYVANNYIYGTTLNRIKRNKLLKESKFKYIMKRIFMPYKSLSSKYPILKKHKWLTPFYEVVRWFRLIFKGRLKSSMQEIQLVNNVREDDINEMDKLMSSLGLEDIDI